VETTVGAPKVVLIGASNLRKCGSHFEKAGKEVLDLTEPTWVPSPENVARIVNKVIKLDNVNDNVFVADLYGNSSFRYEQYDSTMSLPYKSNGRFHMAGNVTVSPLSVFKKNIEATLPIFSAKKNACMVVIPPLPRYMFSSCCNAANHCPNVKASGHPDKILGDLSVLRNCLIKLIVSFSNVRVTDLCIATTCTPTSNTNTRFTLLREVCAPDGVYFSDTGYSNMAANCINCMMSISHRSAMAQQQPAPAKSPHFWRRPTFARVKYLVITELKIATVFAQLFVMRYPMSCCQFPSFPAGSHVAF
jgi:hypothetical protein